MRFSVIWIAKSGQISAAESASVIREAGMISAVNGRDKRFVIRKYLGNVPKYIYAIGPVVI